MKPFLDENFLLENKFAIELYESFARDLPIIDYHCHLPVKEIAENRIFSNLSEIWLHGDHYKWRAMRANGIPEAFITGEKTDAEKFTAWAATVPRTVRNPLFHWTHLELQRYFGIQDLLTPINAGKIYAECTEKLQSPEFSTRELLKKMRVEYISTTDDPVDSLNYHRQLEDEHFEIRVRPAFRPDRAMNPDPLALISYIKELEQISGHSVSSLSTYLEALKTRHDFFSQNGCTLSDHGLERMYSSPFTAEESELIFQKILAGSVLLPAEKDIFRSAMLHGFALWDHEKKWVQQYHLGAIRNTNSRLSASLGADAGCDSIGDIPQAAALADFLNKLDRENKLTKTILYNLNPADNALFATMAGNFNDGITPGKIQYGAAWWFLDQQHGINDQLQTLSSMGLLSRFIGMITDSRSFMSYPRHEYFRRLLCNMLGKDVEKGELPWDREWLGQLVADICYYNAKKYFNV